MSSSKLRELVDEFRNVTAGRGTLLDAILPPVTFAVLSALFHQGAAIWGTLILGALLLVIRAARRERVGYALGGLAASLLALATQRLSGAVQGYLLPDMISGSATLLLLLVSAVVRRPLVAWTSHLARGWPTGWYWHPQVLPAYNEVTLAWVLFYALRLFLQVAAYRSVNASLIGMIKLITGWPATVFLLVASYLYGTWRLRSLGGPSVDEFRSGAGPPWEGQLRGF